MRTKEFSLGHVLGITHGCVVLPQGFDAVYEILNFMTGDDLWTHQLPRARRECNPHLVKQFPQLSNPEMDSAATQLFELLKGTNEAAEKVNIRADWLAAQVSKYGDVFVVETIPDGAHEFKGPVDEAEKMMGDPRRVHIFRT